MVLPLVKKLGIDTSQIAEFSQLEANIDKVLPESASINRQHADSETT